MISPLPFFQLNNIQVKYYATTTYIHAKYMMIDGKIISISSVNWSHASYMGNREAGALIQGDAAGPLITFSNSVFNQDWSLAIPIQITQTYSNGDMAIITDPSPITVTVPPIPTIHSGRFITPEPYSVEGETNLNLYTSPDMADATLLTDINSASQSLTIMMYQVTSPDLCNAIEAMYNAGTVTINLLIAERIYDAGDCAAAKVCYAQLGNAGLSFTKTPWYYTYSHQKFWIVDGKRVGWSTGNWSPTDYPVGGNTFPPYGQSGWRNSNRDYTVTSDSAALIEQFQNVYTNDLQDGDPWTPQYDIKCGY
jgi:phosphatidylserine/phosphatidylglycerophosphate/cardiolipin synthase-like enzyme